MFVTQDIYFIFKKIYNLAPTDSQTKHYKNPMERKQKNKQPGGSESEAELLEKIASLESNWLTRNSIQTAG